MWTIILVLIGVGILMVLLEILVIPGGGLAGLLGFGLMVTAVWLAFSREGNMAGIITLGATIVVNVGVLAYALRSKTWDKAMLKTNIDGKVNLVDEKLVKAGDFGRTISRCAPGGKAIINNEFFEVHARSEFIDEDKEIEVIKLEGNKIFIKSKQ